MISTSAIVIAGKERMMRNDVKSVIHVKTGRRIIVMPGARRLMMVTMKLSAAAMEATPSSCRPMTHMSIAWVGLKVRVSAERSRTSPRRGRRPS